MVTEHVYCRKSSLRRLRFVSCPWSIRQLVRFQCRPISDFLRSISEGTLSFIFLFFFIITNSRPSSFVYLGDIVCKIIILRINKQEEKHLMTYLCKRSWWLIVCPFTCCSPYGKLSGLLLEVAGYLYWSLAEGQKGGKKAF